MLTLPDDLLDAAIADAKVLAQINHTWQLYLSAGLVTTLRQVADAIEAVG